MEEEVLEGGGEVAEVGCVVGELELVVGCGWGCHCVVVGFGGVLFVVVLAVEVIWVGGVVGFGGEMEMSGGAIIELLRVGVSPSGRTIQILYIYILPLKFQFCCSIVSYGLV